MKSQKLYVLEVALGYGYIGKVENENINIHFDPSSAETFVTPKAADVYRKELISRDFLKIGDCKIVHFTAGY